MTIQLLVYIDQPAFLIFSVSYKNCLLNFSSSSISNFAGFLALNFSMKLLIMRETNQLIQSWERNLNALSQRCLRLDEVLLL